MERRKKQLLLGCLLTPLLFIAIGFPLQAQQCVPSKHFVLVHGSCHGAWSWYKIVAQLSSSGHNVTAIDLAASGIDPRQVKTLKSVSEYHRPLMEFMESLPPHEKVILVGHSLGGLAISQAMEMFPSKICVTVFATALMPGPQLNISTLNKESFSRTGSLLDSDYTYDDGPNNPPTTFVFGPMYLSSKVYQLSPFETSEHLHTPSKHFVLVHGGGHGAWCWYKLVPLLRSSGHNVSAIDLAASGINPLRISNLKSISDYTRPLRDLLASLPHDGRVILVGHSLGGLVLSQAMELFPNKISVSVFLTAFMPSPSINFSTLYQELSHRQGSQMDNRITYDDGPNNPPTTKIFGPVYLLSRLYQKSSIKDWTLATTLVRQFRVNYPDVAREVNLTWRKYGSVKRVFIIAEKDLGIDKGFQLRMIRKNPPDEVKEILGSDHMAMISKPRKLWAHLLAIARKYD